MVVVVVVVIDVVVEVVVAVPKPDATRGARATIDGDLQRVDAATKTTNWTKLVRVPFSAWGCGRVGGMSRGPAWVVRRLAVSESGTVLLLVPARRAEAFPQ
jgi:hypothetical protein